jgi:hypothetical protein
MIERLAPLVLEREELREALRATRKALRYWHTEGRGNPDVTCARLNLAHKLAQLELDMDSVRSKIAKAKKAA